MKTEITSITKLQAKTIACEKAAKLINDMLGEGWPFDDDCFKNLNIANTEKIASALVNLAAELKSRYE